MKKLIVLLVAFAFVACTAAPVLAEHDPMEKLKKGAEDVYTVPYDIGKTTYDETKDADFKPFGFLGGLVKGIGYGVKDLIGGAFNVLTFPVDLPH